VGENWKFASTKPASTHVSRTEPRFRGREKRPEPKVVPSGGAGGPAGLVFLSGDASIDTVQRPRCSPIQALPKHPQPPGSRGTDIVRRSGPRGILTSFCREATLGFVSSPSLRISDILFLKAPGCHRVTETSPLPTSHGWEGGPRPAGLLQTAVCFPWLFYAWWEELKPQRGRGWGNVSGEICAAWVTVLVLNTRTALVFLHRVFQGAETRA